MAIDQVRNITDGSVVAPLWYCDFDPTTGAGVSGADPFMLLVRTDAPSLYRKLDDPSATAWELISSAMEVIVEEGGVEIIITDTLNFTGGVSVSDVGGVATIDVNGGDFDTATYTGTGVAPIAINPLVDAAFVECTAVATQMFTLADGTVDGHQLLVTVNQSDSIGTVAIDVDNISSGGVLTAAAGQPAGITLVWNEAQGYWNIVNLLGFA